MKVLQVEDFDYELPEELIAQSPLDQRDLSRLLVVNPRQKQGHEVEDGAKSEVWTHTVFRNLTQFLKPGDVLILNNSRVIPARLFGTKVDTGARVELLLTQALSETEWLALAKPAKRLKPGTVLEFYAEADESDSDGSGARQLAGRGEVLEAYDEGLRKIRFSISGDMQSFLNSVGSVPLPPYIHEHLDDSNRYQTVYSKPLGSVAAPTAGLHFTDELLHEIADMGVEIHHVTLHVGIGTFRPVTAQTVEDHVMHTEWYEVPDGTAEAVNRARKEGRRVIAVGTTALRTLESATTSGETEAGTNETGIFIYPGYEFRAVDALITNFHLPKSTLVMLVSAFMGYDLTMRTYEVAVSEAYRFFSFGDAMFITSRGGTV